ncbi:MAG: PaaI family thioesterase [Chloroflexota bacterium]|nr:PaaI family thioesterase [Chloroflexota bacterium]
MTEKLPDHGSCFVCGKTNPKSIGVEWELGPEGHIVASFRFNEYQQGPPGFVHGGASAAVMDEAMGLAVFYAGYRVVTANMTIEYHKPIPLRKLITIQAVMSSKTERRIIALGEILLPDGSVAVSAEGTYAEANHFFDKVTNQFLGPKR